MCRAKNDSCRKRLVIMDVWDLQYQTPFVKTNFFSKLHRCFSEFRHRLLSATTAICVQPDSCKSWHCQVTQKFQACLSLNVTVYPPHPG